MSKCEIGNWATIADLMAEDGWGDFADDGQVGTLNLPGGEVRTFALIEIPVENGTYYAWKRVA